MTSRPVIHDQLALHGGMPTFPAGPPTWPVMDHDVLEALTSAFRSGDWGRYHGPHVEHLEARLADDHRVPYALTCSSGTFAVELALRGLKITAGDEVILAAYDFSGNFRSIEAVGARPVLVDVDPQTSCLDVGAVADAVRPETKCVLVSHLHSGLAPLAELRALADDRGLSIVEDACQVPGGIVQGRVAGTWGDVGVLSFGGSKLLSAGRGGAIITARKDVHQRAKIFCERGNHAFPLSELQAAVLLPQLEKLASRNQQRRNRVQRLWSECSGLPALTPVDGQPADSAASYYKVAWLLNEQAANITRDQLIAAVQAEGVALDSGFRGFVRRGPQRCRHSGDLPHARRAASQTVLLHHPVLLEEPATIDRVALALKKVLTGRTPG